VRDADARAQLAELMANLWNMAPDRGLDEKQLARVQDGFGGGFATAPVWIVVGGDTELTDRHSMSSSVFPAVQNLLLGATALGLGSAMTTIATYAPDQVRELTGLPEHVRPLALTPLGWPAKPLGPPNRKTVGEVAHRDRYGQPW
jgi:nitroreductase